MNPSDPHDAAREDADLERCQVTDRDWRDYLDGICGVSDPWHDLDSEGIPANG